MIRSSDAPGIDRVTRNGVLTDYYLTRAREAPGAPAFFTRAGGTWSAVTWGTFVADATRAAHGLAARGLRSGERVAIMAPTGLGWETFQLAALLNGAAVLGLDAHDHPDRLRAIARTARVSTLVVQDAETAARLDPATVPGLRLVVSLRDEVPPGAGDAAWIAMSELVREAGSPVPLQGPAPASLATIVFTSGSTGEPKGIAYSHAQVCLAIDSILDVFPEIGPGDRLICWLPLSNLFQRMLNFCAAGRGAQTYFVSDPRAIVEHLPDVRPHVFIAVPRFFEKLHEGIEQKLAAQPPLARRLVAWALQSGDAAAACVRRGARPPLLTRLRAALADRLVLRRLRGVLGGEVRFLVSGSAPFPRWLLERFHAMGLLVLEAYGLSENVVPIAINRPSAYRFGSVGRVLPANTVRIADDGEVMVRGQGVFSGYLDESAPPAFDADGFLPTGDLGTLDDAGFLSLVGRKSEIFKTSTGRKVAPLAIEAKLRQIAGVDHAVLFGAARKVTVALLTRPLAAPGEAAAPLGADEVRRIARDARAVVADEPDYARPAGIVVIDRALTIESGELTSNLKLRRRAIETNFAASLEALFDRLERSGGFCERTADGHWLATCGDR